MSVDCFWFWFSAVAGHVVGGRVNGGFHRSRTTEAEKQTRLRDSLHPAESVEGFTVDREGILYACTHARHVQRGLPR